MRVLVVDDTAELRLYVRILLEQEGCDVIEAGSGEEALFVVEEFEPELIVVDYRMPGMNGLDLVSELQDELDVPVLLYSADSDPDIKDRSRSLGAHYLMKGGDLLNKLRSIAGAPPLERRLVPREHSAGVPAYW